MYLDSPIFILILMTLPVPESLVRMICVFLAYSLLHAPQSMSNNWETHSPLSGDGYYLVPKLFLIFITIKLRDKYLFYTTTFRMIMFALIDFRNLLQF